jgi:hypothetical protein
MLALWCLGTPNIMLYRTNWSQYLGKYSVPELQEPRSAITATRAKKCGHSQTNLNMLVFRWGVHRAASRANRVILVHKGYRPLTPISCSLRGSTCQLSCSGANGKSNHASIHKKESAEREEVPGGNYLRILHAPRFWIHTVVFSK